MCFVWLAPRVDIVNPFFIFCCLHYMYQSFLITLLFKIDTEAVHDLAIQASSLASSLNVDCLVRKFYRLEDPRLSQELFGVKFPNPIGLAAGFDKNCQAFELFSAFGFGAIEIGTVTPRPQSGNSKPRIFRYPNNEALVNRMGFPSQGIERVLPRVEELSNRRRTSVLGVNLGKNLDTSLEQALEDYKTGYRAFSKVADYAVLNISSPNTPKLRELQSAEYLTKMVHELLEGSSPVDQVPILVKLAPDLTNDELGELIACLVELPIAGIIATNTTVDKSSIGLDPAFQGGLSGRPLFERSVKMVGDIFRLSEGRLPIIGVGGVFSGADAIRMLRAGASLIQVYTGFIYHGPQLVNEMNRGILKELERCQLDSVESLVGLGAS